MSKRQEASDEVKAQFNKEVLGIGTDAMPKNPYEYFWQQGYEAGKRDKEKELLGEIAKNEVLVDRIPKVEVDAIEFRDRIREKGWT